MKSWRNALLEAVTSWKQKCLITLSSNIYPRTDHSFYLLLLKLDIVGIIFPSDIHFLLLFACIMWIIFVILFFINVIFCQWWQKLTHVLWTNLNWHITCELIYQHSVNNFFYVILLHVGLSEVDEKVEWADPKRLLWMFNCLCFKCFKDVLRCPELLTHLSL